MATNRNYISTLRSKNGTFTPNRNQAGNYTPPQFDFNAFTPPTIRFDPRQGIIQVQDLPGAERARQAGITPAEFNDLPASIAQSIVTPFTDFLDENKVNILVGFVG